MLTSIKIWNEPNNASHWDLELDGGWEAFSELVRIGAAAAKRHAELPVVLGGLSPIDPRFLRVMNGRGALDDVDVLAVHGFPLDWNLWPVEEWPDQVARVREEFGRPVWITETGVSSFISDEKAAWGMRRMKEVLKTEKVYWYTLLDLGPGVEATTRHNHAEGSGYWRHFHFGLLTHDGRPKPTLEEYDPSLGICQWFQYRDERALELAVRWFERLGVRDVRTGLSWAESHIDGAWEWFDTLMAALEPFEVCATLCFTPPSIGVRPHHTSPPCDPGLFGDFVATVAQRYAPEAVAQLTP